METALHRLLRRIVEYLGGSRDDAQLAVIDSPEAKTKSRENDIGEAIVIVLVARR